MKNLIRNSLTLALLLISLIGHTQADEAASVESIEKLLEVTEVSKMTETMYGQIETMFTNMAQQSGISAEQRPKFEEYMSRLADLLRTEMSFEQMREPLIGVYKKHFSEQDVQGMIDFYETELGQKTVKKMPQVMADSMLISQQMLQTILPKIQELAAAMQKELEKP